MTIADIISTAQKLPLAQQYQIAEALAYYKAIDVSLSQRLTRDIESALAAVAHMPES